MSSSLDTEVVIDVRPIWFRNWRANSTMRTPIVVQLLPLTFPLSLGAAVYTSTDICPTCRMPVSFHIRRNSTQECFMVLEKRGNSFFHPGQDKVQNPEYIAKAYLAGRGKPILLVNFREPKSFLPKKKIVIANFDNDHDN